MKRRIRLFPFTALPEDCPQVEPEPEVDYSQEDVAGREALSSALRSIYSNSASMSFSDEAIALQPLERALTNAGGYSIAMDTAAGADMSAVQMLARADRADLANRAEAWTGGGGRTDTTLDIQIDRDMRTMSHRIALRLHVRDGIVYRYSRGIFATNFLCYDSNVAYVRGAVSLVGSARQDLEYATNELARVVGYHGILKAVCRPAPAGLEIVTDMIRAICMQNLERWNQ